MKYKRIRWRRNKKEITLSIYKANANCKSEQQKKCIREKKI